MTPPTWTVAQLCAAAGDALGSAFDGELWVRGQVTQLRRVPSGHVYLDLADPGADGRGSWDTPRLAGVIFARHVRGIDTHLRRAGDLRLAEGLAIRVRGRLELHPSGRLQLVIVAVDPRHTAGLLAVDRHAVLRRLAAERLVEANGRLPLPMVPLRVALVTSDGSAAYNDFVHCLAASGFPFEVNLFDARVQGAEAVTSLVAAVTAAGNAPDLDVVAVVRGGGSRTDLLAFDHEGLARAVATCPRPVVVGIGHEIDRSVVDEVAHTSVTTPTACAQVLVRAVADFVERVDALTSRVAVLADRALDRAASRLAGDAARTARLAPAAVARRHDHAERCAGRLHSLTRLHLGAAAAQLERHGDRLRHRSLTALVGAERRVEAAAGVVRAVHPARTLARGYSITRDANGSVVVHPAAVADGEPLDIELAGGRLAAVAGPRLGLPSEEAPS
jgi:exodeoxyribonuclease VII large subunit